MARDPAGLQNTQRTLKNKSRNKHALEKSGQRKSEQACVREVWTTSSQGSAFELLSLLHVSSQAPHPQQAVPGSRGLSRVLKGPPGGHSMSVSHTGASPLQGAAAMWHCPWSMTVSSRAEPEALGPVLFWYSGCSQGQLRNPCTVSLSRAVFCQGGHGDSMDM